MDFGCPAIYGEGYGKGAYRRLCPQKRDDGVLVVGGRTIKLFLDIYNTPGLILLPYSL